MHVAGVRLAAMALTAHLPHQIRKWMATSSMTPSELTADALGTKTATATSAESASPAATTSTKTAAKKSVNAFKVAVIAVICAAAAALFGVLAHVRRKK